MLRQIIEKSMEVEREIHFGGNRRRLCEDLECMLSGRLPVLALKYKPIIKGKEEFW